MLVVQMTSSVKITVWGGQLAIKKETAVVEVVDTSPLHPSSSIMAATTDAPADTFFNSLSGCRSTEHLFSVINENYVVSTHFDNTSPYALHCHNPMEYHITEVAIFKQRFMIQHEGFVFRVHHQPGHGPAEPDFFISIDRNIDSTPPRSIFSFHKVAIDRVNCSLFHPMATDLQGTFRHPMVWRMPALPGQADDAYEFNLNLLQVGVLLRAIIKWNPNPQYHALQVNCFSHSRVIRTVLRYIIQGQQDGNNNITVTPYEPYVRGATLGKCFGFHLDREDYGESAAIYTAYIGQYSWFTA